MPTGQGAQWIGHNVATLVRANGKPDRTMRVGLGGKTPNYSANQILVYHSQELGRCNSSYFVNEDGVIVSYMPQWGETSDELINHIGISPRYSPRFVDGTRNMTFQEWNDETGEICYLHFHIKNEQVVGLSEVDTRENPLRNCAQICGDPPHGIAMEPPLLHAGEHYNMVSISPEMDRVTFEDEVDKSRTTEPVVQLENSNQRVDSFNERLSRPSSINPTPSIRKHSISVRTFSSPYSVVSCELLLELTNSGNGDHSYGGVCTVREHDFFAKEWNVEICNDDKFGYFISSAQKRGSETEGKMSLIRLTAQYCYGNTPFGQGPTQARTTEPSEK
jgi:hypothetical protein